MKKIALLLVCLMVITSFAFAEEEASAEDKVTALEERVAALEGAPAVSFGGSVEFNMGGNSKPGTPNGPQISGADSGSASVSLSSGDDKVEASLSIDLFAQPSVDVAISGGPYAEGNGASPVADMHEVGRNDYQNYVDAVNGAAWYSENREYKTPLNETIVWDTDSTGGTTYSRLVASLSDSVLNLVHSETEENKDLKLKTYVSPDTTNPGTDEFTTNTATQVSSLQAILLAFNTAAVTEFNNAVQAILDELSADSIRTLDDSGWVNANAGGTYITTTVIANYMNGLTYNEIKSLSTDDRKVIVAAFDFVASYERKTDGDDNTITVTSALDFISGAGITIREIGGYVDVTASYGTASISTGEINVDKSGHQEEAAGGNYGSLGASISSGVVEGLEAGVTFYVDATSVKDEVAAVADDWYTWLDETVEAAEPVEPKYGLGINAGYSTTVADMTIGADVAFGLSDLAGGDDLTWGIAVSPSFEGFGAKAALNFAYALDIMLINFHAEYDVLGWATPYVTVHYVNNGGDYVLQFVEEGKYGSTLNQVYGLGGVHISAGTSVSLANILPETMSVSLNGGADVAIANDADVIVAWDAAVAVSPLEGLEITASVNDAGIKDGEKQDAFKMFGWDAGVSYTNWGATFGGNIGMAYNEDADSGSVLSWGINASYVIGAATVSGKVSSGWDKDNQDGWVEWTIGTSVSF